MNIRKFLPLTAFSIWMITFSWLLWDDNFQFFLKPSFKGLVIAGLVFSVSLWIGLAVHMFSSKHPGTVKHSWINGLILVLPVLFIFPAGQNTLGEYAMQKRSMAGSAVQREERATSDQVASDPSTAIQAHDTEAGQDKDISISTLIREFDRFDGKRVSIQGLFAKNVSGHDELSAVFRYLITCCVADAMPVGVFVSSGAAAGIENNQWVRAEGKVELRKMDGFDVIFMDADNLHPLEIPDKRAVYIYN